MKNSVARTQPEKSYDHMPKAENLPLVAGSNFHDDPLCRNTLRKSHTLGLDRKTDHAPHTEYNYSYASSAARRQPASAADDEDEDVWNGWFSEDLSECDLSDFIVRMKAYFVESVPESPVESERVRKVCIKFFVFDDSITIIEHKEANSGIVQSTILSRRQVPKDASNPDEIYLLPDFDLGVCVNIYGTTYTIVDMDRRSRRYLREIVGRDIGAALEVPEDNFARTAKVASMMGTKRAATSDDMDRKRAIEQQIAGIYTKHSNEDIAITKEFLKNRINEHLTYLALWDDRGSISGDVHRCIIRVFLENSSVEVVEARPENSGYAGSPIIVSRQRIPCEAVDFDKSRFQQHTYGKLMKSDYLTPTDIQMGETYKIHGKPFYVFDADAYTRKYMSDNFGMTLGDAVDVEPFLSGDKKSTIFYPPPPNGFGSEREKRRDWLSLTAKPARIDHDKIRQETGRIMNFSARLVKPLVRGDEEREFVITFYRETDELEISEKPRRNSGFLGGRFLAKGKHWKDMPNGTTIPFTPNDFQVGAEVVIFKRAFFITDMDSGTKRILEGEDKVLTEERIRYLVVVLRQQLNLRFLQPSEAYLALAPQGTLGYTQIKEFLRSCSCDITDEEAVLVIRNISPGTDGVISYSDFVRIVDASASTMDEASLTTRSVRNVDMDPKAELKASANASEMRERRRQLKQELQHKLMQRKGSAHDQFRLLSRHSPNSRLNREVFRQSLNEELHFNTSPADEDVLVALLFDGNEDGNGDITLKQFQEFIDSL